MAYIDNNGITFNTFDNNTNKFTKKLSHNKYTGATVDNLADIASENGGKLPTILNAVEIDWNGADWSSIPEPMAAPTTINTTGDLLNAIKYASTTGPRNNIDDGQYGDNIDSNSEENVKIVTGFNVSNGCITSVRTISLGTLREALANATPTPSSSPTQ